MIFGPFIRTEFDGSVDLLCGLKKYCQCFLLCSWLVKGIFLTCKFAEDK